MAPMMMHGTGGRGSPDPVTEEDTEADTDSPVERMERGHEVIPRTKEPGAWTSARHRQGTNSRPWAGFLPPFCQQSRLVSPLPAHLPGTLMVTVTAPSTEPARSCHGHH